MITVMFSSKDMAFISKWPPNGPHETIFRNGNIAIRLLETLRVTKIGLYILVPNSKSHITAHMQKVPK